MLTHTPARCPFFIVLSPSRRHQDPCRCVCSNATLAIVIAITKWRTVELKVYDARRHFPS